jgi:hypothetical protein
MSAIAVPLDVDTVRTSGFPVYSLHYEEKHDELHKLLEYDHTRLIQDGVIQQTMHGLSLAWHFHPHAWGVRCGDMLTPLQVFGDDDLLAKALARRKMLGNCKSESDLRKALRTFTGTQSVSNFRPTAAAAIYDRYLRGEGGAVWDMSAGFGGRLLGALACRKVAKYIGTDPATLTMDGLCEMRDDLTPIMMHLGCRAPEIELQKVGSEDFIPEPESLSLCFSSSPYGSHERYSDEPTQSYLRFPSNKEWLHGYMRMTLDNCRVGLKQDGFLVMNLADTKTYPTLTRDFLSLAKDKGFTLMETLQLALSKIPGTGKQTATHKFEPVYVFRRN